jgi:hypothetical protein
MAAPSCVSAGGDALPSTPPPPTSASSYADLPEALTQNIMCRLPVDARMRCAEVCRSWRAALAPRQLWTALDLSASSGVRRGGVHSTPRASALLLAASARAGGTLRTLDASGWSGTHDALLQLAAANATALRELRTVAFCFDALPLGGGVLQDAPLTTERVQALLRAAPLLAALEADVTAVSAPEAVRIMLRGAEQPFAPLRVRTLQLRGARLHATGALHEVVDAALAARLPSLDCEACRLPAAAAEQLARLLAGGALTHLTLSGESGGGLFRGHDAALMQGALRECTSLQSLSLNRVGLTRSARCLPALLRALTAHPSLRTLRLLGDEPDVYLQDAYTAAIGAAAGELVAADAPSLTWLQLEACSLNVDALTPLYRALPRNRHLRRLECGCSRMSEAHARRVVLPALHANASLRSVRVLSQRTHAAQHAAVAARVREAEAAVAARHHARSG